MKSRKDCRVGSNQVHAFFKVDHLRDMNSHLLRAIREQEAQIRVLKRMLFFIHGHSQEEIVEFAENEPYPNPYARRRG